jgi:hypothetical protein
MVFHISLISWLASYGIAGWINAGGEANRDIRPNPVKYWSFRVMQTLAATLLTPVTALAPIVVITYSIIRGRRDDQEVQQRHGEDVGVGRHAERLNSSHHQHF